MCGWMTRSQVVLLMLSPTGFYVAVSCAAGPISEADTEDEEERERRKVGKHQPQITCCSCAAYRQLHVVSCASAQLDYSS